MSTARSCRFAGLVAMAVSFQLAAGDKEGANLYAHCPPDIIDIPGIPLEEGQTLDSVSVELEADEIGKSDDNRVVLKGNAQAIQGQRSVFADELIYDRDTLIAEGHGNVQVTAPVGDQFTAEQLKLHIQSYVGAAEDVGYRLANRKYQPDDPTKAHLRARGEADSAEFQGIELTTLHRATYTTCPEGNNDVEVRARKLVLDQVTGTGTASGLSVRFKSIPIFYFPKVSFPISDERRSGFLFPSFGTDDESGFTIQVPWYWNISPNKDATFFPRYYSDRGFQLGAEIRYLGDLHEGIIEAEYMPDDDLFGDSRSAFRLEHDQNFGENWSGDALLQYVSDEDYIEDLSNDIGITSSTHLRQRAAVDYVGDSWTFDLSFLGYKTVDSSIPDANRPYERLPQMVLEGEYDIGLSDFSVGLDAEAVNFDQDNRVTGTRLDLTPYIQYHARPNYGFFKTKLDLRHTTYSLTDQPAGDPDDPNRTVPIFSMDGGLYFDRDTSWGGKPYTHSLEPRIKYVYIPFEDQSDIPNFDTGDSNLENFGNIFRDNRFFGADRVGDTSKVILGFTSRYTSENSGWERGIFSLGQIYFLRDRRVGLNGEILDTTDESDILFEAEFNFTRQWYTEAFVQYDTDESETREVQFDFGYDESTLRRAEISYRFTRDSREQLVTVIDWPLTPKWDVTLENRFDIDESESFLTRVGFGYKSCCWAIDVIGQQRRDSDSLERNAVFIQFELTGLGRINAGL